MRIKKISQTVPIAGTVVNSQSDSKTNTYSCDYVNGTTIIESGSNTNGNYIKFGDGTLLQYSLGIVDPGKIANGYVDKIFNLPISFIDTSYVVVPALNSNSTATSMGNFNICPLPKSDNDVSQYSISQFKVRFFNNSGGERGPYWSWVAIGRWKNS